jgi:hypothetical protein
VLELFDITLERARGEVVRVVGVGEDGAPRQIPLSVQTRQVLASS